MMLLLPIYVAASGLEGLVWLVVALIWLVFQGLAHATKKKLPPPTGRPTTPDSTPEREPGMELRELFETLSGQKPGMIEPEAEEEEPPALPRPTPLPRPRNFKAVLPPSRWAEPARNIMASPPPAIPSVRPPPAPPAEIAPAALPVFARAAMTREALRLAPLLKMKWPRSQFQHLAGAAHRTGHAAKLKRQLTGQTAMRQAMVSRIVLGPPGGRL